MAEESVESNEPMEVLLLTTEEGDRFAVPVELIEKFEVPEDLKDQIRPIEEAERDESVAGHAYRGLAGRNAGVRGAPAARAPILAPKVQPAVAPARLYQPRGQFVGIGAGNVIGMGHDAPGYPGGH